MKALPLLVIWGVWIAQNNLIFSEKCCTPELTATLTSGILEAFPQHIRVKNQRNSLEVVIDKTIPWAFFDGVAQDNRCGGGAYLFMREGHLYKIKMGLGEGSNNFVELFSLKLLLIFAAEKGCNTLACFGDSMNVINWVKNTQVCRHLRLENIITSIADIIDIFYSFSCSHVYRENNREANFASKEGLLLMEG